MNKIKLVGVFFVIAGIALMGGGGFVVSKAQSAQASLDAVYATQDIHVSYNDEGQFIDRGTVEAGDAILSLLTDTWKYPLNEANLDPNDPLVNTPDELMLTYARITYHVIHGTQTVTLDEPVEYNGEVFEAGEHEFAVDGRFWEDFDRMHPIEGPARGMAWSPTAHALLANLTAGTASHSLVQFVYAMGFVVMGIGLIFLIGGLGLAMAGRREV